jgi:HD superfamily phosphohydrolase
MPPQLKVLKDLVSGEMDADRSDYLLRDSHHCGVEYGRFDHRRMIQCLDLHEAEGGTLEIALHRDGIHTFEAKKPAREYVIARFREFKGQKFSDFDIAKTFDQLEGAGLFD